MIVSFVNVEVKALLARRAYQVKFGQSARDCVSGSLVACSFTSGNARCE